MSKSRIEEWFDRIYVHAEKKEKSEVWNPKRFYPQPSQCMYHSEDGAKCFVGLLIPDDVYNSDCEGRALRDALHICGNPLGDLTDQEYNFLLKVQKIHDDMYPDYWQNALLDLAVEYNFFLD